MGRKSISTGLQVDGAVCVGGRVHGRHLAEIRMTPRGGARVRVHGVQTATSREKCRLRHEDAPVTDRHWIQRAGKLPRPQMLNPPLSSNRDGHIAGMAGVSLIGAPALTRCRKRQDKDERNNQGRMLHRGNPLRRGRGACQRAKRVRGVNAST